MTGCQKAKFVANEKLTLAVESTPLPQPAIKPSSILIPNSPIRNFDFKNFTYPEADYGYSSLKRGVVDWGRSQYFYKLEDGEEPEIRNKAGLLKNSPASFSSLEYSDLTGDNEPEALIELSILTGGSALANSLYVYTWSHKHPQKIFSFSTGDRADGGFRKMYVDNGDLVIELNAGDENAPDCDGCQSTRLMRLRYKWEGRKFVKVKQEILPIR